MNGNAMLDYGRGWRDDSSRSRPAICPDHDCDLDREGECPMHQADRDRADSALDRKMLADKLAELRAWIVASDLRDVDLHDTDDGTLAGDVENVLGRLEAYARGELTNADGMTVVRVDGLRSVGR